MKKTILIFSAIISLILVSATSHASISKNSVPTGKDIKDQYLEQLFTPEFPYENVKVIETKEGKRYVVIKAKDKVTDEMRLDYENKYLRKKGIVIFNSGSPRTDRLLISQMRLYRVASEVPYVVEYCEVRGKSNNAYPLPEVESVVKNQGYFLSVLIDKDFGKVFKKVEIIPKKEPKCPEPPFVGKYPNSRSILCTQYYYKNGITFLSITEDKPEDVYNYFKDRLKEHFNKVGFNYPEVAWKYDGISSQLGMRIAFTEIANLEALLSTDKKQNVKTAPKDGVVFRIVIHKLELPPATRDYSLIVVYYTTDKDVIDRNIKRMKRRSPE